MGRHFGGVTSVYRQADFDVGPQQEIISRRHLPHISFKYCYSVEIRARLRQPRCGERKPAELESFWSMTICLAFHDAHGKPIGMTEVLKYRGRCVSDSDVQFIRELIASAPQTSRRKLSALLCEAWDMRNLMAHYATWCAVA